MSPILRKIVLSSVLAALASGCSQQQHMDEETAQRIRDAGFDTVYPANNFWKCETEEYGELDWLGPVEDGSFLSFSRPYPGRGREQFQVWNEDIDNNGIDDDVIFHLDAYASSRALRFIIMREAKGRALADLDLDEVYSDASLNYSDLTVIEKNVRLVIDGAAFGATGPVEIGISQINDLNFLVWKEPVSRRENNYGISIILPDGSIENLCTWNFLSAH